MTNTQITPTAQLDRIDSVDIIRGIALLGILLMNITGFGLYRAYYDPTNSGGATGWDLKVWWVMSIFFEGTMRGLFSMLFGAGIILFNNRKTSNQQEVTDAFFRRILWLFLFGIIHAYLLLWYGEILYPYAIIALFAFSFRVLSPKKLIIASIIFSLCLTAFNTKDFFQAKHAFTEYNHAIQKKNNHDSLSTKEQKAIKEWETIVASKKANPDGLADAKEEIGKGYFSIVWYRATTVQLLQTTIMYRQLFWDIFAMMLLGMAFIKNGIFKANKSYKYYLIMMSFGYIVGLSTNYWEAYTITKENFSVLSFFLTDITHELGRVPTTIGHIGLIMLIIKSGKLKFLQKSLAAVGQMAFTNYIVHTVICIFIFMGFGFNMFCKLSRHELYYVVFAIWALQLLYSQIWLRYFKFGPLEWCWRSLTYWQKQPFRK